MSAPAHDVEVREVAGRRERRLFIRLPWTLYRSDPLWVPPLLSAIDTQLDPTRHPFFKHAEARLYLARRQGRPVGRIAAIVNRLHNSTHGEKAGFWGFFETERDPAVAAALLDAAADDLRRAGMTRMTGPFNPSINSECGLLVDGFDRPPVILMPYNPPWYPDFVEAAGLEPEQDLHAYWISTEDFVADVEARERLERIAKAVRRRHPDLTVRPLDMARYDAEVMALGKVFDAARRANWGYVPTTDAELRFMAREMKPIVAPEFALVAELRGQPIGCLISLPDINLLLRKLNGRLFPFGWARLLLGRRRLRTVRVFGAGCLPEYRTLGVTPLLFDQFVRNAVRLGCEGGELSWVAEDNLKSMRTIESAFRPRLYKRYRIYNREL